MKQRLSGGARGEVGYRPAQPARVVPRAPSSACLLALRGRSKSNRPRTGTYTGHTHIRAHTCVSGAAASEGCGDSRQQSHTNRHVDGDTHRGRTEGRTGTGTKHRGESAAHGHWSEYSAWARRRARRRAGADCAGPSALRRGRQGPAWQPALMHADTHTRVNTDTDTHTG